MSITIEYTPSLPAGTHEARVTAVETRESKKTGQAYRWWEFTTEDGRSISAISSMNVGPKSKSGQWIAALLGRQPVMGESVEVIGLPCLIGVSVDEEGFSQVDTVIGRPVSPKKVKPVIESVTESEASPAEEPERSSLDALPF
jgi:hypothetical protein